jgi:transcriptional regulator with XRE-family HTH domain
MTIMDKIKYFQKLVRDNRRLLIAKGFHPSTITMWMQGKRFPSYANAKKISGILKISVKNFPVLIRNK